MIVPMKKVSLVVLDRYKDSALKKLRSLGLVHVEQLQGNSEKLSSSKAVYGRLELASFLLSDVKVDKKNPVSPIIHTEKAVEKAEEIIIKSGDLQVTIDIAEAEKYKNRLFKITVEVMKGEKSLERIEGYKLICLREIEHEKNSE